MAVADEVLGGGLANFGQVVRRGDVVERPAPPHAEALHRYLRALRDAGFDGAPEPKELLDGREVLSFVPGDVAVAPFPEWSRGEPALASVGRLLRRLHEVAAEVPVPDADWPAEFRDPAAKSGEDQLILCHNDVCQENVVFRDGEAAALIDFDFAAPGRPLWDLAFCAWYWVPMVPDEIRGVEGMGGLDALSRLRVLADAYGLDAAGRRTLLELLPLVSESCHRFVDGRVASGDPVFTEIDAQRDPQRWDKIQKWLAEHHEEFLAALGVGS
ncbi:aminoglycoside phosphotransferase family protein [Catenulispora subtropica]|uniref:Phosphotransferase n=1 Tax=Catenulispora subtropica TaxID=450798 RepID=A0ABN2SLF6_9ACTN